MMPIVEPTIQDTLNQLNNFQSYEGANSAYNFILLEAEEKSAFNMKMSSPPKSNAELCEHSDCGIMDGVGLLGTGILAAATCGESIGLACGGSAAVLAWGVSEFDEECGACIRDHFEGPSLDEIYPPVPINPGYPEVCDIFWPNCYSERPPLPDDECDNVVEIYCDSEDPTPDM